MKVAVGLFVLAPVSAAAAADAIGQRRPDDKDVSDDRVRPPETAVGWPTYMHDNARSGVTRQKLAVPLSPVWVYRARHKPRPAWPPPAKQDFWHNKHGLKARVTYDRAMHVVSDGKRVCFGSSADDQVRCLDLATGRQLWTFFTEGPVRLAPSLHDNRIYFGSDDGAVYCLAVDDGSLVWEYRLTESDRRIPGNGRIISSWPVRTGVLVHGGHVRFAAGLFPTQGTYQYAVDADTGKLLSKGKLVFSPQGYIQQQGKRLMIATGRSPTAALDPGGKPGKTPASSLGQPPAEYPYALVAAGNLRFAGGDGKVAVLRAEDGQLVQALDIDGKAYGLAVAGGTLLVSTDQGSIHCFRPDAGDNGHGVGEDTEDAQKPGFFEKPGFWKTASAEQIWSETLRKRCSAAADRILAHASLKRGYCLVYGCQEGGLAYEIARRTELTVVGIEPDSDKAARARRALDRLGFYGRVAIHHGRLDQVPYASKAFNLVVSETALIGSQVPGRVEEVARLIRPAGGVAYIGRPQVDTDGGAVDEKELARWLDGDARWQVSREDGLWARYVRKPLAGAGQWTHIYAEPGNTACSGDELIRAPFLVQWYGGPGPRNMIDRHHRTVPPLYCGGRLFVQGNERVFAVDAYNGTVLWSREIPGFRRIAAMRDTGNMAAAGERLFLVAGDKCRVVDAQTGQRVHEHSAGPASDGSRQDWGYVAVVGDRLYGSSTRPGASRSGHSRAAIGEAYWDRRPIVTSTSVYCCDSESDDRHWWYCASRGAILNPTITIGQGRVYFVESNNPETLTEKSGRSMPSDLLGKGSQLVAIDATSGQEQWRKDADFKSIEHHLYLCHAKGRLVAVGSRNHRAEGASKPTVWYDVFGFDAADGELLWRQSQDNRQGAGGDHGEQDHHPAIVGNMVFVEPLAYDLKTGKRIESWKYARGGHGCGTFSASANSLFFRAGNPTYCDLATGTNQKLTQVTRPGCWINIIPAGGLVLIPEASSGCTCNFSIQTSLALIPIPASLDRTDEDP